MLTSSDDPHSLPRLNSFRTLHTQNDLAGAVMGPKEAVGSISELRASSNDLGVASLFLGCDSWEGDGWNGTIEIDDVSCRHC